MNAQEAQDNLEMIDRIVAHAAKPRGFSMFGGVLVAMGFSAALIEIGSQLGRTWGGTDVSLAGLAAMILSYLYLAWLLSSSWRNVERLPRADAFVGRALGAVWTGVVIAAFAQPHLFSNWAGAAIWNLGAAIQMLLIGFFVKPSAIAAGAVLLASMIVANYVATPGYALAAGFVLGYIVPGILFLMQRNARALRG